MVAANSLLLLLLALLARGAEGFGPPVSARRQPLLSTELRRGTPPPLLAGKGDDGGGPVSVPTTSVPYASYFLLFVTLRSAWQLVSLPTEVPGALLSGPGGPPVDAVGTAFDLFFVSFGVRQLVEQSGLWGGGGGTRPGTGGVFAGTTARVTLDVGREAGTMMEGDWAASGARLLLPVNLAFSPRPVEIDFPGEEGLGGRRARRLDVLDDVLSFVGPAGEVRVEVDGGAWAALPIDEPGADPSGGAFKLRFFLDFPSGAARNDVTLPPGRVFFSGVGFTDVAGVTEWSGDEADRSAVRRSVVEVDGAGTGLMREGRLTCKRNGFTNLWGSFGDTNAILGRYRVDSAELPVVERELDAVDTA